MISTTGGVNDDEDVAAASTVGINWTVGISMSLGSAATSCVRFQEDKRKVVVEEEEVESFCTMRFN